MTRVFVFPSDEAGILGTRYGSRAVRTYGAVYGAGVGRTGDAYALPVKRNPAKALTLAEIAEHIHVFRAYAHAHPALTFDVQGFSDALAPLFRGAPDNVLLPAGWRTEAAA
jgi:hypothetical protein